MSCSPCYSPCPYAILFLSATALSVAPLSGITLPCSRLQSRIARSPPPVSPPVKPVNREQRRSKEEFFFPSLSCIPGSGWPCLCHLCCISLPCPFPAPRSNASPRATVTMPSLLTAARRLDHRRLCPTPPPPDSDSQHYRRWLGQQCSGRTRVGQPTPKCTSYALSRPRQQHNASHHRHVSTPSLPRRAPYSASARLPSTAPVRAMLCNLCDLCNLCSALNAAQ